jgi:thiosulfate/3-mercaptopyruvate sulfurtransferase
MKFRNNLIAGALISVLLLISISCSGNYAESGTVLIDGKEAAKLVGTSNVVLVDAQKSSSYAVEHVEGAVNIERADIVKSDPVVNMLADKEMIEEVFGSRGIGNDTTVIIYDDNNNMDASRLWWTLMVYGHENVKVVSGGLTEMKRAGFSITTKVPPAIPTVFTANTKNTDMIATTDEVLAQVDDPDKNTVLIDTRTQEEFNAGTIPSSVHINYINNNYSDGTYRKIQDIRIIYKEAGIEPTDTVIMYCKTSIRGAQTYLALYNAGYRNLKLYDGAWLEWVLDSSRPVQVPETVIVQSNAQDNS